MEKGDNKNLTPAIEVRDLVIDFGETLAVNNISFKVYPGELVTLLGPSGCGKTTTLNALAGLLTPTSGQILFKSRDVTKFSPQDRKLGLVFQNYALYPHMSVYKNIAFPLSNDQEWKNRILRKNEMARLEILQIILEKNGAKKEELQKLKELFETINANRKKLNIRLQQKISQHNQNFFEAKTQYQLVGIHKNSELVNEARKVFDLLKEHRKKLSEINVRIKITKRKKKILQEKRDKNPEIFRRIKDYNNTLKELAKKKEVILKENKKEIKIAKEKYEKEVKRIKKKFHIEKVVSKWKLNIAKKIHKVETVKDLKEVIVGEILSTLNKEISEVCYVKHQWINQFNYPKNNISNEAIKTIDGYIEKLKQILEIIMSFCKDENETKLAIRKAKDEKNLNEVKELNKKIQKLAEKKEAEKARLLKEISEEIKTNNLKVKKEINDLKVKIKNIKENNKSDEVNALNKQLKILSGKEMLDNPKNQISILKARIEKESKEQLLKFRNYKKELIAKYSLNKVKLSDKENEEIYQIEKRIISISTAIKNAVLEVANKVDITKNLAKKPTALSGGQQQRVAIARAIVKSPDVILMDEPLSNLDAKLRISTREWIRRIQKELGMTTIFVTHDQEEAMSISDRIINMSTGVIQQIGSPMELYLKPKNKFVATFLGMPEMMIYRAEVSNGKVKLNSKVIGEIKDKSLKAVDVGIRAEHLKECNKSQAILAGKIEHLEYLGKEILAQLTLTNKLEGKIFLKSKDKYEIGEMVYATAKKEKFHFFSPTTEERIE